MHKTLLASLVLVALYNLFFFKVSLGIGLGVVVLLVNLYFYQIRESLGKNINNAILASILSILFAFLYGFRDNPIVQAVNLLTAIFFALVSLYLYKNPSQISLRLPGFLLFPLVAIYSSVSNLFGFKISDDLSLDRKLTSSIVRGIVITVPVFIVLFFLLTNADPIFGKLAQRLVENLKERVIFSTIIFVSLFAFGIAKIREKISETLGTREIPFGRVYELSIILGSIVTLFGLFITVQFKYLFSNVSEGELGQLGVSSLTYSEYVRRGFFELLIVSVISSLIILFVFRSLHHLKDKQKLLLQLLTGFLTVETMLILVSGFKRLVLYYDAHGLTRARVFGFIFLVWLSLILVILLMRVFREWKREWILKYTVLVTLLILFSMNLVNIDGLIATKFKPTVNDEIDYYYLTSLSADAHTVWLEAFEYADNQITKLESLPEISEEDNRKLYWADSTVYGLDYHINDLRQLYGVKENLRWQSFNISQFLTYKYILENRDQFDEISKLQERLKILHSKVGDRVRQNTPIDRSTNPPLTP